jgi:hypothetical protein
MPWRMPQANPPPVPPPPSLVPGPPPQTTAATPATEQAEGAFVADTLSRSERTRLTRVARRKAHQRSSQFAVVFLAVAFALLLGVLGLLFWSRG